MKTDSLALELTDRCNLACAHCLRVVVPAHSGAARDMDVDLIRRLVLEAKELGIPHLAITGGESLLHPRFLDVVDAIADAGLTFHLMTNGHLLPTFAPTLLVPPRRRAALTELCISLDGATEQTHDRVRGTGSFRRAMAGIAVAHATRTPFSIVATINRANRAQIDQLGLLTHHLGAQRLILSHMLPSGRPTSGGLELDTAERLEVEEVVKRLIDAMRFPIKMGSGYYDPNPDYVCRAVAGATVYVDPDGQMTFCCELSSYLGENVPAIGTRRLDWVADLNRTSLRDAIALHEAAAARFRAARLADDAAGRLTEDDHFPCRYCIRHFGKVPRK